MERNDSSHFLNAERTAYLDLLNFNKAIVKAKGSYLYTDNDEALLDFTSQYGAVPFGHNPDFLCKELQEQIALNPGVMIQPFHSKGALELSRKLVEIAPGKMHAVTLASSGAEAVEVALKMAKAKTKRRSVLATHNSFHGKTMAASLATGNPFYSECFHQASNEFSHVPFDDVESLEKTLATESFAAFIVEPIQGEGGMIVPSNGYLKACEKLCKKYGTLLIVDEIQVGLGRTGSLFVCDQEDVKPDILVSAKALGGGLLPISACISNKKAWSQEFGERHSSTFANSHLAAHIGCCVVDKLISDDAVLENVKTVGRYLSENLQALVSEFPQVFKHASGVGFMQGIALMPWNDIESYMSNSACNEGLRVPLVASYLLNRHKIFTAPTLNAGNVLRIQPGLLATESEIDILIEGLRDVGLVLSTGDFSALFREIIKLKPSEKPSDMAHRVGVFPEPSGEKLGTFAFLIHPTTELDAVESLPGGAEAYDDEDIEKIKNWIRKLKTTNSMASAAYYVPCIPSKKGGYVDGWLISSLLTPRDMLRLPKAEKARLMNSYIAAAQEKGANVIGLGAFTSVISRSGSTVKDCGTPLTTGNAYTALTSTDSIRLLCKERSIKLGESQLGVVGVSGSVGRLSLLDLGADCKHVALIGNAKNKDNVDSLEAVAGEFLLELCCGAKQNKIKPMYVELASAGIDYVFVARSFKSNESVRSKESFRAIFKEVKEHYLSVKGIEGFPISLSNDIENALPQCQLVLTATSNGEAFIRPEYLAANSIVCDVARPSDLSNEVLDTRSDVTAYEGGLVKLPANIRFGGPNIVGLDTGVSLACLSETIILCMSQVDRSYSLEGISPVEEARDVYQMGCEHGFTTFLPDSCSLDQTLKALA